MSVKNQICDYCGKKQKGPVYFAIGANVTNDINWTFVEGSGKYCCPNCYDLKGREDGKNAVKKYLQEK